MNFQSVNQAIINLLGANAIGRYTVVGFKRQGQAAVSNRKVVQSYYAGGTFAKSSSRQTGPVQHAMTFGINLSVSTACRVNLSVIDREGATQTQISTALAAMQEAAYLADTHLDNLAAIIFNILMDGRTFDLGFPVGCISNRWVEAIKKGEPSPKGELVSLDGVITYSCNTVEEPPGDQGLIIIPGRIDTQLDIIGDDVERTGVIV